MAFLVTAYAPTSFPLPCIVLKTDDCEDGPHTTANWVSALNADHAIGLVYDSDGRRNLEGILQRPLISEEFTIRRYSSWNEAAAAHVELAKAMENGQGDEKWEQGMALYQEFYDRFYQGVPK